MMRERETMRFPSVAAGIALSLVAAAFTCVPPPSASAAADEGLMLSRVCSIAHEQIAIPLTYPTGWLTVGVEGIPTSAPVSILSLPGIQAVPHRAGEAVAPDVALRISEIDPASEAGEGSALVLYEGSALVLYEGAQFSVDPDLLLVNLPDVLPEAKCDVVYSYASTSSCAGEAIPGVTGQSLPGYANGAQESAYWDEARFVVPCAYRTALKLTQVESELERQGYKLLVYDAYRPMEAQHYLSDCFQAAYDANPAIRQSLDVWSLGWYVASGPSGHNYGTDIDVGACDLEGRPLPMPSGFDSFDESGHLTDGPIAAGDITPEAYRQAVRENDGCMALHRAFARAGFSELASEWWHFADEETETLMRALVGSDGLDFIAKP